MRRSGPDFAANSERTGSFHLVNSHRLIMLFPASTERQKVLECAHKSVEKCHYTYVAQFKPSQEEVCDENFEKSCQITFKQQAYNETVRKCCRLTSKVCNGEGSEEVQDGLRVLLHHQVRGEAAWQVCRGHWLLLLELLGLENRLLSMLKRLEVGRHRVNLAILFLIPVEALQGNVFPGQLGNRHKRSTRLLGSELLLGSKLLLRGNCCCCLLFWKSWN